MAEAVCRRRLTAWPHFISRPVRVGFIVDEVTLGQVCLRVFRFHPLSIIPPPVRSHTAPIGHQRHAQTPSVCDYEVRNKDKFFCDFFLSLKTKVLSKRRELLTLPPSEKILKARILSNSVEETSNIARKV
jgi:hypothetical protein